MTGRYGWTAIVTTGRNELGNTRLGALVSERLGLQAYAPTTNTHPPHIEFHKAAHFI